MRPDEYEKVVADYFEKRGYEVEMTSYSNDFGVDLFAFKANHRVAVQVKMYGNTPTKINRQIVMELHGAKDYFDCDKAIIATNGKIIPNALEVAQKLKIDILTIPATSVETESGKGANQGRIFEDFWERYVVPLEGKTLSRQDGTTNKVLRVDWSGVEREPSGNRKQKIRIEIFRKVLRHLYEYGTITRAQIHEEYKDRASSGIVLILSNTPIIERTSRPVGLKLKR